MLDSVIKASKKYYPQTLLEECKYEAKKTKMENLIKLVSTIFYQIFISHQMIALQRL